MKEKKYFVHESASIDEKVEIGEGTQIWHFSHIMKEARIGKNCKIGQNVYVDTRVRIGDNVKIQNNVSVYKGVTLKDYVFCGPSMVFTNIINPRSAYVRDIKEYKKTLVREGATIGANATIMCGITIGKYAFIGAGTVVTKNVPDYALIYGNPGRIHGWMCECGEKLKFVKEGIMKCKKCGKKYKKQKNGVRECKNV